MSMIERSWLAEIRLWEDPIHTAFLIVQLSHPCMTTGKTIALTRWTFVGKVMSMHFTMPSRLIITFLPRSSVQFSSVAQLCPILCNPMNLSMPGLPVHHSKCLLISWLQSSPAVILEPPKIKSAAVSTIYPSIYHEVMEPDAMIFVFWMLSFKPTFSLSSYSTLQYLKGYVLVKKSSWQILMGEKKGQ